jgi:hypothetical protein
MRQTCKPREGFHPIIPTKPTAGDPSLRPRGHWDHFVSTIRIIIPTLLNDALISEYYRQVADRPSLFLKDLHQESCDNHDTLDVSSETKLIRINLGVRKDYGNRPLDASRIRDGDKEAQCENVDCTELL